ncbi:hypothetical protein [Streptomyces chartreusis]|uniref:Uncharacterized protein n=1 Tax=Streptomyces chartreusis TaxID=1969 RepID=A0A7H8T770_STRCX|nr:hypothetical protein [Streptomyces chartreusis]QKZ18838.1 hypothetical protein HUT05_16590 [Streptomyces chartreusis]
MEVLGGFDAHRAALDDIAASITDLQRAWSENEIRDRVRAATTELQASEPHSPYFDLYNQQREQAWAASESAAWVRTYAIVHAADEIWGDFDRSETSPDGYPAPAANCSPPGPSSSPSSSGTALPRKQKSPSVSSTDRPDRSTTSPRAALIARTLFRIFGLPWVIAKFYARAHPAGSTSLPSSTPPKA